jgi:predicted ferric reductase
MEKVESMFDQAVKVWPIILSISALIAGAGVVVYRIESLEQSVRVGLTNKLKDLESDISVIKTDIQTGRVRSDPFTGTNAKELELRLVFQINRLKEEFKSLKDDLNSKSSRRR